jgi:RNA polymerase sigma-70 factor (ECF subfamily)
VPRRQESFSRASAPADLTAGLGMSDVAGEPRTPLSERPSEVLGDIAVTPVVELRPPGAGKQTDAPIPVGDDVVEATKRGETWAWEAAYLAYAKALMGFLVLRLGDRDEAAEALSETFLRALDRAASLRGGAESFRAWLFRIARNVANDRMRARRRFSIGDFDVDPVDLLLAEPDAGLIAEDDARQVRDAFAGLEEDDREILWLRVCARLSSAEVGDIVGKKPGAVRMQQQRALGLLAHRMGIKP